MTTSLKHKDPLPVMESFYTIQGEGAHQGRAAISSAWAAVMSVVCGAM